MVYCISYRYVTVFLTGMLIFRYICGQVTGIYSKFSSVYGSVMGNQIMLLVVLLCKTYDYAVTKIWGCVCPTYPFLLL